MDLIEILNSGLIKECSESEFGTDKERNHAYISNFYEKEFSKFKDKEIRLLEIGIYTGDSLKMWKKYFTKAEITGVDITLEKVNSFSDDINYLIADAYDEDFTDNLNNYDIIIDDGPHSFETQFKFIELYYPLLNKGGIMVVEDLHHETELINELIELAENLGAQCEFIDTGKLYNSKLISIKKL
jgi:hypothetical protein